jgi:gliding motility-associated-like protein
LLLLLKTILLRPFYTFSICTKTGRNPSIQVLKYLICIKMRIKNLQHCFCWVAMLLTADLTAQTIQCSTLRRNDCNVQINANGGVDGPTEFCEGQTIRFLNSSTITDGQTIDSTLYCWGDGSMDLLAGTTPGTHTYNLKDTCLASNDLVAPFEIKMIVFKKCAAGYSTHYLSTPIGVRAKPKVSLSVRDTVCADLDVTFKNLACQNDSAKYVSVLWDFGDGTTANTTAASLTHRYTDIGDYTVTLTVTNRCGSRSAQKTVHVATKPAEADLRVTKGTFTVVEPYVVCLRDSGIVHLDGSFSKYAATFKWATTAASGYTWLSKTDSSRIRIKFKAAGTYNVTLQTNNRCGVLATKTITFKVVDDPILTLNPQNDTCREFTYRPRPIIAGAIYTFDGTVFDPNVGQSVTFGLHTVRATFDSDCGHQEVTPMEFTLFKFTTGGMVSPSTDTTICLGTEPIPLITNQLLGGHWVSTNPAVRLLTRNDSIFFNPQFAGIFPLTYTRGTAGCATTTGLTIHVVETPKMTLSVPLPICEGGNDTPLLSTFQDGNAPTTLNWTFVTGSPATFTGETPPAVTWNTLGSHQIIVSGTNLCGTISDTTLIAVLPNIRAKVDTTIVGSCLPVTADFKNTSENATNYNWNIVKDGVLAVAGTDFKFDNSTSNTTKQLTISFLKHGNYSVALQANGLCQSDNWTSQPIVVKDVPHIRLDAPSVCIGANFSLNSIIQPANYSDGNDDATILWTITGASSETASGLNPPEVNWNAGGTYSIKAVISNHCGADSATVEVMVLDRSVASATVTGIPLDVCAPFEITVNNSSSNATGYRWVITDTVNHRVAVKNVDYEYINGSNSSTGSPEMRFLRGGIYKIGVNVLNACANTNWDTTISVRSKPLVTIGRDTSFCISNAYQPGILTLNDGNGNEPAEVRWVFPGGTPGVYAGSNPPLIRYDVDGIYPVICIAQNNCGSDTTKQVVTILPTAKAAVSISGIGADNCVQLPFTLTINNVSTNVDGFKWTLQDENDNFVDKTKYNWVGNDSTVAEPILTILKKGRYRLRLTLNNVCQGATWDTLFQIHAKPDISVNPIALTGVCTPQNIGFQGNLLDDGGLLVHYQWHPTGDSTLIVPARRFDTAGVVQFVLTATNLCGTDSDSTAVTIQSRPIVLIQHPLRDTICNSAPPVHLTASPVGGTWSGTGVSATGVFDPAVLSNGTYPIVYQYGKGDCVERDTYRLTVFGTPVNAGAAISICDTATAPFKLLGATPLNGLWSGTGIIDPVAGKFSPAVSGAGVQLLIYTFTDPKTGCANQAFKQVTVYHRPKAVIDTILPGCRNTELQLTGANSLLSTRYQWQFGDGDTSILVSPRHTYLVSANYTTRLIVTSRDGCKDTTTRKVRIASLPVALPVPKDTTICHASTLPLRTTGVADTYLWTYPNGTTSTAAKPAQNYRFNNTGLNDTIMTMRLSVTNIGCPTKTDTLKIKVFPQIKAVIASDKNEICHNDSIRFANPSRGHIKNWYWDLGNGMTSRDSIPFKNVGIRYQTENAIRNVNVRLIVEGDCGRDTAYYPLKILPITTRAFFNMDKNIGCPPLTVRFENRSSSFAGITYDFGDNTPFSSQPIVNHTFKKTGTYKILLYAFNTCGGFDTISQLVTVREAPPIDSITYKTVDDCRTADVQFKAYTHGLIITGYFWRFDNQDSSRSGEPIMPFKNGGIHKTTLTLFSGENNCPATDSIRFPLLQPLDLTVSKLLSDSCGTADGVIVLNPRGGKFPYQYSLDDSLYRSSTPIFKNLQGRQYHIGYVKDARGCTDTVEVFMAGVAPLSVNAGGDLTVKLGESVFVQATMNFNPASVQWKSANPTWIQTPKSASTWITPLRTQVFSVSGRTAVGCVATDTVQINVIPIKFVDCPSAFSPNNDGENDTFKPQCSKDVVRIRAFRVFNRWGAKIYERLNFNPHDPAMLGWDGNYNSVEQPVDVYSWYCEADFLDATTTATPMRGTVTLIR